MTYDHFIYLIRTASKKNNRDELIKEKIKTPVYADIRDVGYKEKNQARADGLEPTIKFILAERLEYNGEKDIEYNGEYYRVVSSHIDFKSNGIELTCSKIINSGGDNGANAEERYENKQKRR